MQAALRIGAGLGNLAIDHIVVVNDSVLRSEAAMQTMLALAIVLAAASPAPAQPEAQVDHAASPRPPDLSVADRAEIDSIFRRWERAWVDGDAVAWSQLFHEDGVWILWTGGEWRGRAEIAKQFAGPFATFYRDSVQLSRPIEIRPVAPGVIVVRSLTTLTGDARQPGVTIYGKKILLLTRTGGRWAILYGQNTRLNDAEAAKAGPKPKQ